MENISWFVTMIGEKIVKVLKIEPYKDGEDLNLALKDICCPHNERYRISINEKEISDERENALLIKDGRLVDDLSWHNKTKQIPNGFCDGTSNFFFAMPVRPNMKTELVLLTITRANREKFDTLEFQNELRNVYNIVHKRIVVIPEIKNTVERDIERVIKTIDTKIGGAVDFLQMEIDGVKNTVELLQGTVEVLQKTIEGSKKAMEGLQETIKEMVETSTKRGPDEYDSDCSHRFKKHRPPNSNTVVGDVSLPENDEASISRAYMGRNVRTNRNGRPPEGKNKVYHGTVKFTYVDNEQKVKYAVFFNEDHSVMYFDLENLKKILCD